MCRNLHKLRIIFATTICGEDDFVKRGVLTHPLRFLSGKTDDPLKRFYRNSNIHNVFILRMCPVTVMV